MVNKREFKKYVEAVGASVCNSMMEAYYNVQGIDQEACGKAVARVLGATSEAKSNANRTFDRGAKGYADVREYAREKRNFFHALFTKINADFSAEIDAALKEFNAAIPENARKANIG